MPFVSIIIPVYNVEKYIKRCIDSILKQNYDDYEIILVNDGSVDNSGSLCDQIADAHSNIIAVHKENGGLASARNYGLKHIKGQYVVFIDADDWVAPHFFAFLDEHLRKNNLDVLKYGYQRVYNNELGKSQVPYYEEGVYDRSEILKCILPGAVGPIRLFDYEKNALLSACTCAYSVEFLKANKIIFTSEREILNEDFLFNFHVLLCANQVEVTHEILYMYYFRDGSLSKNYIQDILSRKQKLMLEYKRLLDEKNLFRQFEKQYYNGYADSMYACITNECSKYRGESSRESIRNIKAILNQPECRKALKLCNHSGLTKKGWVIYHMMRIRAAFFIYWLYRMMS